MILAGYFDFQNQRVLQVHVLILCATYISWVSTMAQGNNRHITYTMDLRLWLQSTVSSVKDFFYQIGRGRTPTSFYQNRRAKIARVLHGSSYKRVQRKKEKREKCKDILVLLTATELIQSANFICICTIYVCNRHLLFVQFRHCMARFILSSYNSHLL